MNFVILSMAIVIIILICLAIYLKNKFKTTYDKNIYLNDELQSKENKILDLEDDLKNKINSIKDKEKIIIDLHEKSNEFKQIIEDRNETISNLEEELGNKEDKIFNLEENLDNKIDSIKNKENEINNLNSELNKTNQTIEYKDTTITDLKDKLEKEKEYMSNLLEVLNAKKSVSDNLENYKELLNKFIDLKKEYNFNFLTNIFSDLKNLENEIELISTNPFLYNKNIIAIGGGFSSGKSSFINTLFEIKDNDFLPVGNLPVTAIPSYIFHSKENKIECLTVDGRIAEISESIFKKISKKNDNDKTFNAKNIVKHFYVKNQLKYKNICFIDIPGYNPAKDSEEDLKISKEYINNAKVLIWLFPIPDGTTSKDDLKFLIEALENHNNKIIYIVCAKADLRGDNTIKSVCDEINKELKKAKIKAEGISPYTSNYIKLGENKEYFKKFKYGVSLNEFLNKMNKNDSYKVKELNNKIENIFEDNIKLGKDEIENIDTHIKFLRNIKLIYISDISERDGLIYRYKSLYKDLNTEDIKSDNIDQFEKDINNRISDLEKNKIYIKECISDSNKIKNEILKCINNIFNEE